MTAGGPVEDQTLAQAVAAQLRELFQDRALQRGRRRPERRGGARGRTGFQRIETLGQAPHALCHAGGIEVRIGCAPDRNAPVPAFLRITQDQLPRPDPVELGRDERGVLRLRSLELSGRYVEVRQTKPRFILEQRSDVVGAGRLESLCIADQARGSNFDDLAPHESFGLARILHLLGNRDRMARAEKPADIAFHRVVRHTAHGYRIGRVAIARGEHEIKQWGGDAGIVEKELVEVPHAVQQQGVAGLSLERQVLLHHRCLGGAPSHCACSVAATAP